ncbi:hypothetical protein HHK36_009482 [Tetracentron sinense]|uniref:Large ribosomal subunit protein uL23m n=1 Tax=Tetracentron sinense TaxID=13715 RepID=A0A834ZFB4_TETSI|nr:hypothetical protein HHK36_009482 [Tetracentron sinense]
MGSRLGRRVIHFANLPIKLLVPSSLNNIREIALKTIPSASKIEINRATESLYGFEVEEVRALNMEGKKKKRGGILFAKLYYEKAYSKLSIVEEGEVKSDWLDFKVDRFKPEKHFSERGGHGHRGDCNAGMTKFPWSSMCTSRRAEPNFIAARLDMALANPLWRILFPSDIVWVLPALGSDHHFLLLGMEKEKKRGRKPFRYEQMWDAHEDCIRVVRTGWQIPQNNSSPMLQVHQKISSTREALVRWNKQTFGNLNERINILKYKIAHIQDQDQSEEGKIEAQILTS